MQEASTSGTRKDVSSSSPRSPTASTSTANTESSSNTDPSSTSRDKEKRRKSTSDDEECETIPNKNMKFENDEPSEKFDLLVNNFNEDVKGESNREKILKIMCTEYFSFYRPIRDYLIKKYSTLTLIEENSRKIEYHVCNICGGQFKTKLILLIKHILIKHQMKWPKEVKIDSKRDIAKEKLNKNVENGENPHEKRMSTEVSTSTDDLLWFSELEKCINILNSSFSITKEMLDSQKKFVWKVKTSPDFMDNLICDARKSNFSIILNKHVSANKKTFLSFIITYFSNNKICSHFYRLIEVKSEDFLIDLKNQMTTDRLKIDRFVGFGYEFTEIKDSIMESTLSDLQKIKKYLGLKAESNIIINRHLHESVRVIMEGVHECISRDVEFLLKETYMWFKSHKGQTNSFSLEEQILESVSEEHKVDVWIFKFELVYIVINNWAELKEHFGKIEDPYIRWRIHGLYENNVNEMYLKLIQDSLISFKNFFEFLNYSADVTKDRWTEKLEKVSNALKGLATVSSETSEQPVTHFQNNKKKFLNGLESAIQKFLKNNNSSTPIAIPISNERIENIISCISQSINNFKDDFSTETAELLETCVQIKFMKTDE